MTMSPPHSLHAKRWALIKEGSSEASCSHLSDNASTNNDFSARNNNSINGGSSPPAIHTRTPSQSDDDTTMPSAAFSETFNVFTMPGSPSKPLDDDDESEPELSKRSKNKKKMLRSPLKTVNKTINDVLFGTVGLDPDTASIDGLFTKEPEIRRISVCSEDNLEAQGSGHSGTNGIGGLKRRNTTRPKGPGGEPFGNTQGLRLRNENNKCLIEIEGDSEMLEFVDSVTAVEPPKDTLTEHQKSPVKMNKLNGFKSSLQQCGQSITDDEEIPSPLMSSTFINDGHATNHLLDIPGSVVKVEPMEVEEARPGSFNSHDLPIIKKDPPPESRQSKERNGAKRLHEVDRHVGKYSGAKSPDATSSCSDSEDMYSSDQHSSQLDLNNSMLPPIHSHDVRKVVSSEEPDFVELERYFPSHHMKLFIGTWNMQSLKDVPMLVEEFLMPPETQTLQDIYVLGTQECSPHKRDWEVSVQATLGPTHVLVRSECLGDIHLMVLVRREMIWYMREIQSTTVACGPGGVMRNKGAVGIILTFFGTSLLFITSHLAAQTSKLKERNSDYLRIAQYMTFTKSVQHTDSLDITDKVDCTFWFGDLNYRVTAERDIAEDLIHQDMLEVLLNNDQLRTQMETSQAFTGFSEGHIQFPPTFKFDPGTENYDTSPKQRVPSWTDRILYKSQQDAITPLSYSHVPQLMVSDHRPVYGVFQVKLKPMLLSSTIHATGWFDKRAYARGMKRRRLVSQSIQDPSAPKPFKPQRSIMKKAGKVANKPIKKVIESSKGGNSAPSNKKSFVCGIM